MTDIQRIAHYEELLDRVTEAAGELEAALEKFRSVQDDAAALAAYYESGDWRRDFEDDEAGRLPPDLKRGVLSEDAVYNALSDNDRLSAVLKALE
ncbi:MAG: DUF4298 domain-containing protein [Clostridia bacterium]|nr:DUF4298 domain-containing protein [Clostridia bacterium]